MIHEAQARLSSGCGLLWSFGPALVLLGECSEEFDLFLIEDVAGRFGAAFVARLNELQDRGGRLGGNGGELEKSVGGFEPAVFELQPLGFDETEQLFDDPAFLVPGDDLPSGSDTAHFMGRQQVPVQRLDARRRVDFNDLD